ncbi:hypothetical protein A0J61_09454, partial [Choanephora cucurbitarum]
MTGEKKMKSNHLSLFVLGCLLSQDANAQFLCAVFGNCDSVSTVSEPIAASTSSVGSNSIVSSSAIKESIKSEPTSTFLQVPTQTTTTTTTTTTTAAAVATLTTNQFNTPFIGFPTQSLVYTTPLATFSDLFPTPSTIQTFNSNYYRETFGASSKASSSWNPTTTTSNMPSSSLSSTPSPSTVSKKTSDDSSSKKHIIIGAVCAAVAFLAAGFAYVFLTQRKKTRERTQRLSSMTNNELMQVGYDDYHTNGGSTADNNKTTTQNNPYSMSEPQAYNNNAMMSPQPPLPTANPTDPYYPSPQMAYNPND